MLKNNIIMQVKQRYVCGFLFDSTLKNVVLIWKEKPKWQAGKLNGVGGKIEPGETPDRAMWREFKEETGLDVDHWNTLIVLGGSDWEVHFFYAVDIEEIFEYADTKESEEVAKIEINALDQFDYIPNLQWLIPMAIYCHENINDRMEFSHQRPDYYDSIEESVNRLQSLLTAKEEEVGKLREALEAYHAISYLINPDSEIESALKKQAIKLAKQALTQTP